MYHRLFVYIGILAPAWLIRRTQAGNEWLQDDIYIYIYIYVCVCVYIYMYIYIYLFTYFCMCIGLYINIHIYIYISVCVSVCLYTVFCFPYSLFTYRNIDINY